MKMKLCFFLFCLFFAGCKSMEEQMAEINANRSIKRVESIKAIWKKIHKEEITKVRIGSDLSSENKSLLQLIADTAQKDPDPQVRANCFLALGESFFWYDRKIFIDALNDKSWRCQLEAVKALRCKKCPIVIPEAIQLLKRSKNLLVRVETIKLLQKLEAKEAIPVLYSIVANLLQRNRAQMAANVALKQLSGQDFSSEDYLSWQKWYKESYLPAIKETKNIK